MAVRLYLPSDTGSPGISPTPSGWERGTSDFVRREAVTAENRPGSAMVTTNFNDASGGSGNDVILAQYIFGPLSAQTLTGTVKGQIRAKEDLAFADDFRAQITVRVIASDGATARGTALDFDTGSLSSEFSDSTLTNRAFPRGGAQNLSSVNVQSGDYLVIEIGYRKHAGSASDGDLSFGDDAASDLPEDESTTTALNPWIEFSDLVLTAPVVAETSCYILGF